VDVARSRGGARRPGEDFRSGVPGAIVATIETAAASAAYGGRPGEDREVYKGEIL